MLGESKELKKLAIFLNSAVASIILTAGLAVLYCFFDGGLKTLFLVTMCVFAAVSIVLLSFALNCHHKHHKQLKEKVKDLK